MKAIAFIVSVCLFMGMSMSGCASSSRMDDASESDAGRVVITEGSYEEVFAATREVLSDYRFAINRVDASRGVITTHPKRTVGLASLWDEEQSTLGQEWEDLTHQQERTIRVIFDREGLDDSVVEARVEVVVLRVHRPHWRVETESMRLATHARSRDAMGRVEPGSFREPIGQDLVFAQRVADAIVHRVR